jgi:hypothetical protein
MYYRNAQAAVVVYDVTKAASLEKAKSWVKELQRQANPNIVIALAGNKKDLVTPAADGDGDGEPDGADGDAATATPGDDAPPAAAPRAGEAARQVPTDEAQAYAQESGLLFFETSAKTGDGIVEMFTEIGACAVRRILGVRLVRRQAADTAHIPQRRRSRSSTSSPPAAPAGVRARPVQPALASRRSTWTRTRPRARTHASAERVCLLPTFVTMTVHDLVLACDTCTVFLSYTFVYGVRYLCYGSAYKSMERLLVRVLYMQMIAHGALS